MSDWKNDNVEYVFACNYDDFNEQFKARYDRDATQEDWILFKQKFSELRTSYISQGFHDGINEIIEEYYGESDACEGCKQVKEPDGLEVSCDECGKTHGCSDCNGSWTVRERHFCDDCDDEHGYDMFCCDQCGNEDKDDDNTVYYTDKILINYTFCNDSCFNYYKEKNKEEIT